MVVTTADHAAARVISLAHSLASSTPQPDSDYEELVGLARNHPNHIVDRIASLESTISDWRYATDHDAVQLRRGFRYEVWILKKVLEEATA